MARQPTTPDTGTPTGTPFQEIKNLANQSEQSDDILAICALIDEGETLDTLKAIREVVDQSTSLTDDLLAIRDIAVTEIRNLVRIEERNVINLLKDGQAFKRDIIQKLIARKDLRATTGFDKMGLCVVISYLTDTNDRLSQLTSMGQMVASFTNRPEYDVLNEGLGSLLHGKMDPHIYDTRHLVSIASTELYYQYDWEQTMAAYSQMQLLSSQLDDSLGTILQPSFGPGLESAIELGFGTPEIDLI